MKIMKVHFIVSFLAFSSFDLNSVAAPVYECGENILNSSLHTPKTAKSTSKAFQKEEKGEDKQPSVSTVGSSENSVTTPLPEEDPFCWQIGQHYHKLVQALEEVATKTLLTVVKKLI